VLSIDLLDVVDDVIV